MERRLQRRRRVCRDDERGAVGHGDFHARPVFHALTVSKLGTGSGTVTSNPGGIDCGATCTASYLADTVVNLSAAAAAGSSFTGWSGACSGAGACAVTMSAAQSVTATFTLDPVFHALTVSKMGTGSGTVTSDPAGINCGATCAASYLADTVVTLTASRGRRVELYGVERRLQRHGRVRRHDERGAVGHGDLHARPRLPRLDGEQDGHGQRHGHEQSSGINCGPTCTASYLADTVVNAHAAARPGRPSRGGAAPAAARARASSR